MTTSGRLRVFSLMAGIMMLLMCFAFCAPALAESVAVRSVSFDVKTVTLKVGETKTVVAKVSPGNATNPAIKYTVKNSKIATVDQGGKITALKKGSTVITATAQDGSNKKATYKLTVKDAVPTSVSVKPATATIKEGEKVTISAAVLPVVAKNKAVTWSSSNKKIATVSSKGVVTGKSGGTVTITATTKTGKLKAKATVTVIGTIKPTSVAFSQKTGTAYVGDTVNLSYTVNPANATDKSVTFKSSNTKVATVSSTGQVKALKVGTAKITVTTKLNKKSATYTLTVKKKETVYRAILIGEENYYDADARLSGPKADVNSTKGALLAGGYSSSNVKTYYDQTAQGIVNVLNGMSSMGIKSDDVTVFFYSGHGLSSNSMAYRGALVGVDGNFVLVDTVRQYLDKVPGTVIVVMDSCLSGQYIYSKSAGEEVKIDPDAYNQSIVDAFSSPMGKGIVDNSPVANKYKILTAADALGNSYVSFMENNRNNTISVFSFYLSQGCGYQPYSGKCNLFADSSKDKKVTMTEIYNYIKSGIYSSGFPQATQLWPANDQFVFVKR